MSKRKSIKINKRSGMMKKNKLKNKNDELFTLFMSLIKYL